MFKLPPLGYPYEALEPYIDKETMKIHHDKHHQAYVDNLNKALEGYPDLSRKTIEELLLEELPSGIRQTVINNGGGHFNHSFFWKIMGPKKTKRNLGGPYKKKDQALKRLREVEFFKHLHK